jgi:hypothetical protein
MTTRLHLVPRLRLRGAIPSLLHTSSWRDTLLSAETTLPVPSLFCIIMNAYKLTRWSRILFEMLTLAQSPFKELEYLLPGKKVKFSLCLTKHRAIKTYWGVEV